MRMVFTLPAVVAALASSLALASGSAYGVSHDRADATVLEIGCKNIGNGDVCVERVGNVDVRVSYKKLAGAPFTGQLVMNGPRGFREAGSQATWTVGSYYSQVFWGEASGSGCVVGGVAAWRAGDPIWGGRICF